MYTKGAAADLAKAFLDYVLSPDIQNTLLPTLFYAPAGS
jgi:phosphate transport system substrate-binding protein